MLEGSCHCGAVRLTLPSTPEVATACNCSLCRRIGGPWVYYEFGTVKIEGHPENTAEYIWGDKTLRTIHCKTCGCVTHWEPLNPEPGAKHGVNLGNFDPRVLAAVRVRRFDGADTWTFIDEWQSPMSIDLYDASIPVFLRYLDRLDGLVGAAESHANAHLIDVSNILRASIARDMLPFETQVVIACNFALRACFPLVGKPIPPYGEFPATAHGLHQRIAYVVGLLRTIGADEFEGREAAVLESQAGNALVALKAPEFLLQYALPNFFFHVTVAYAILRGQGVAVGKEHFDGFHAYVPGA